MTRKLQASTVRLSSVDAQALTSIFPNSPILTTSSVGSASLLSQGQGRAACHRTRPSWHRIRSNSRLDEVVGHDNFPIIRAVYCMHKIYPQDTCSKKKLVVYLVYCYDSKLLHPHKIWSLSRYIFPRISGILTSYLQGSFLQQYIPSYFASLWSKRP